MTKPTLEDWMDGVKKSYRESVTEEEYDAKATPSAVARVAAYLMNVSGNDELTLQDLSDGGGPYDTVQILMDFIATEVQCESN